MNGPLVAMITGIVIGVLLTLGAQTLYKISIGGETIDFDEESLCPHGVPWDECPDCCH